MNKFSNSLTNSFSIELGIRRDGSGWGCTSGAEKNKRQSGKNRMTSRLEPGKSLRHRSRKLAETAPRSPSRESRTEKRSGEKKSRRENATRVGPGAGQGQGRGQGAGDQRRQGGRQSREEDRGHGTEAEGSIRVVVVVEVGGTGRGHDHDPAEIGDGAGVVQGARNTRTFPLT